MIEQYLEFLESISPAIILFFSHPITKGVFSFISSWWWVPLPYFLWKIFLFFWAWWRVNYVFLPKNKNIILDIRVPSLSIKPIRAMEIVLSELFQIIYKPPDKWEKWIDGQVQLSYSFDVVSIEGEIHFMIRMPESIRDAAESIIYSQYPEAEITLVDDYAKKVPSDIPNEEWDIWGSNYVLTKPSPYPIKTYDYFETEKEDEEGKIIDPISSLLEGMAKIGKGEQLWLQIMAKPIQKKDFGGMSYWSEIEEIKEELSRRKKKVAPKRFFLFEMISILLFGPSEEKIEEKELIPPEMKLTPVERETLAAVEKKASKLSFKTAIRFIYLGRKNYFFKPHGRLLFGYFSSFNSINGNSLMPKGQPIMTKIKKNWFLPINLLRKRRLYLRKRRLFKLYVDREDPYYPRSTDKDTFVLSTEELATLFHFPSKGISAAPLVFKTESRKRDAPSGLPVE